MEKGGGNKTKDKGENLVTNLIYENTEKWDKERLYREAKIKRGLDEWDVSKDLAKIRIL